MRKALGRLVILSLSSASLYVGLKFGRGAWTAAPVGLPDAGALVSWTLHISNLFAILLSIRILGLLTFAGFIAPTQEPNITQKTQKQLRKITYLALLWALTSSVSAIATLANSLGLKPNEVFAPGVIQTYIWELPSSRSFLLSSLIALAIAILIYFCISLNSLTALLALTIAGIVSPLLNSHSSGLGDHSLALTSAVIHGVAISFWVGGLLAIFTESDMSDKRAIDRYAKLAAYSFIALVVSGFANAYTHMNGLKDLFETKYGQLVLAKIILLILATISAIKIRSMIASNTSKLKFILFEIFIMVIAIGAGVALHATPPVRNSVPFNSAAEDILGFAFPKQPQSIDLILGWHPEWLILTGSLVAGALYLAGLKRLSKNQIAWPLSRSIFFFIGLALVNWATSSGVSKYAMVAFSAHMMQHMFLSMLAPIFIVLSAPITLALRALPSQKDLEHRNSREWILAIIHSQYSKTITNPLIVLAVFTFGLYGLYFTSTFATLMSSHTGHVLMEMHFLFSGILFAYVVVGIDPAPRKTPYWAKLLLVLVAISMHAFFAIAIMQSTTPIGDAWYSQVRPGWLTDPLADNYLGGGFAWAFGEVPTLFLLILVALQWAKSDKRTATRIDRQADRDGNAELRAYNENFARLNKQNSID